MPGGVVEIDDVDGRNAGHLAAQYALRGYDAVHLACALQLDGDDTLLATWAEALNAAREREVIRVLPWTERRDDGRTYLCIPVEAGYAVCEELMPDRLP